MYLGLGLRGRIRVQDEHLHASRVMSLWRESSLPRTSSKSVESGKQLSSSLFSEVSIWKKQNCITKWISLVITQYTLCPTIIYHALDLWATWYQTTNVIHNGVCCLLCGPESPNKVPEAMSSMFLLLLFIFQKHKSTHTHVWNENPTLANITGQRDSPRWSSQSITGQQRKTV